VVFTEEDEVFVKNLYLIKDMECGNLRESFLWKNGNGLDWISLWWSCIRGDV